MWRAPGTMVATLRRSLPTAVPRLQTARWCAWAAAEGENAQSAPIYLRESAVQKLKSLQDAREKSVLRLMVNSGGCSGYSYDFNLVEKAAEDDVVVERDGARLVVDEVSLTFLEECEVDYVEEMIRSSFQVVKNKLADSKCGCGSSFSVNNF
mmetsp:Transcript_12746/g.20634  ORF Transcript_12746/g.20634 Transcript_12746/m.20634 type:complete len:152 (-) Transcript_12746:37-492(-)